MDDTGAMRRRRWFVRGSNVDAAKPRLHPLVRTHYPVRLASHLLAFLLVSSVWWDDPVPVWIWVLYGIASPICWPHLVFFIASRSERPREVEFGSLMAEAFAAALLITAIDFRFWPGVALLVLSVVTPMFPGGVRLFGWGLVMAAAGLLVGGLLFGFEAASERTSALTHILSAVLIVAYSIGTAWTANVFGNELRRSRRLIRAHEQQLEVLSAKLSKYLSPQIYRSIFTGKTQVRVASQRKPLTVMFSDIEAFTPLVERMEADVLTELLNTYLQEMARIVVEHGGTIDKYMGDAVMVFFGDPESQGAQADAIACVRMAVEMRQRLAHLEERWQAEHQAPIRVRYGIHSGPCTVGNFGSELRLDYTIIGHSVNVASRLESAAAPDEILVSTDTWALVSEEFEGEPGGTIELKGVTAPMSTYRILGPRRRSGFSSSSPT